MFDYRDFTYFWFGESNLYQSECPHCGRKASYDKEEITEVDMFVARNVMLYSGYQVEVC